jgi:hypothetical protein
MSRWERRPEKVAAWLDAGGDVYDLKAGHIQAFLAKRGVDADVSVRSDGTIVVESEATPQKLRPALDALDPATLDPIAAKRAAVLAALRVVLGEIRGRPELTRTPAERAVLLFAVLQGLDEAEETGNPGALADAIDAVVPDLPGKRAGT